MKKQELLTIDLCSTTGYIAWARVEDTQKQALPHIIMSNYHIHQEIIDTRKKPVTRNDTQLIKAIETCKSAMQGSYDNLAAVIINIGPGSFTGLRIALAFAKGLQVALNCKIIGIDSMELWAHIYNNTRPLLSVVDARSNKFYCKLYVSDSSDFPDLSNALSSSNANKLTLPKQNITQQILDLSIQDIFDCLAHHCPTPHTIYFDGYGAQSFALALQLALENSTENSATSLGFSLLPAPQASALYASSSQIVDETAIDTNTTISSYRVFDVSTHTLHFDQLHTARLLSLGYTFYLEDSHLLQKHASPIYIRNSI